MVLKSKIQSIEGKMNRIVNKNNIKSKTQHFVSHFKARVKLVFYVWIQICIFKTKNLKIQIWKLMQKLFSVKLSQPPNLLNTFCLLSCLHVLTFWLRYSYLISLLSLPVFSIVSFGIIFPLRFRGRRRQWVSIGPLVLEWQFILTQSMNMIRQAFYL